MVKTPEEGSPAAVESRAIAAALQRMVSGEQFVDIIGQWRISNLNSPINVELFFDDGKAIFGFSVNQGESNIKFVNYHREASTGSGTPKLMVLEESFMELAEVEDKKIDVAFPVFGQEDTRAWLLKNGYVKDNDAEEEVLHKLIE